MTESKNFMAVYLQMLYRADCNSLFNDFILIIDRKT